MKIKVNDTSDIRLTNKSYVILNFTVDKLNLKIKLTTYNIDISKSPIVYLFLTYKTRFFTTKIRIVEITEESAKKIYF